MCPQLRWVHRRSAGLDTNLFPELAEGSVVLTNGSGVFGAGAVVAGYVIYQGVRMLPSILPRFG
jgi:hypothetical protein